MRRQLRQCPQFSLLVGTMLLISALSAQAQGIKFQTTSFSTALETARRANKILFVEIYLNGCPHCAALAPVLEEKKVGDFFNANFISMKLEANSEDSKVIQTQKGITYVEFPLFLFFDPASGSLIHQAPPMERPNRVEFIEEVLRHGSDVLDPGKRSSAYAERYAKGDRDFVFLVNYAKYAKATKNKERLELLNRDIAKALAKPSDAEGKTGFYILQNLINDITNPLADYFFKNLAKYQSKYPAKEVKDAGELILFLTMYESTRAAKLTPQEIANIRERFLQLGVPAKMANSRTLLKELEAYFRQKETAKATARLNQYAKTGYMVFADYAYLVKYFNEKATDNSYVSSVSSWVTNGVKLLKPNEKNTKEVADLYAEQAKALLKVGNKQEAKKAAQKAVEIGTTAKTDTSGYRSLLASIK
ncbi:thioredoxin family protein [Runella limosa]|uniref:thioredoxin family protein n=1 Tax=Runella limosa TaxID=370978 RepID=UPI00048EF257|nr:thioredoxin family protein [Runella limosa]